MCGFLEGHLLPTSFRSRKENKNNTLQPKAVMLQPLVHNGSKLEVRSIKHSAPTGITTFRNLSPRSDKRSCSDRSALLSDWPSGSTRGHCVGLSSTTQCQQETVGPGAHRWAPGSVNVLTLNSRTGFYSPEDDHPTSAQQLRFSNSFFLCSNSNFKAPTFLE